MAHKSRKKQKSPAIPSREWLLGVLLCLAVIAAYSPVWWLGYIWDDDAVVTANPVITGPLGLKEIWTTSAADICPFTLTTFWAEYQLWGPTPLPYHLVNVLMHAACAVLLWRVLPALRIPGAWLGAALWALHPVQVESVAWIAEMKNTESGIFFLLSILFFVKGLGDATIQTARYALTLLFAALAITSKTSTVILPVVLCLCAWWMEGRWRWSSLVKTGPIFLLSLTAGLVSIWTQKLQLDSLGETPDARGLLERLITAGDAIWFYFGKLIWPYPLLMVYPRWNLDAGQVMSYLPLLSSLVLLVVLWFKQKSWSRAGLFAFAYFLIALAPAIGLVSNAYAQISFVADRFQYLASMGPMALVGAGIAYLAAKAATKVWLQPTLGAVLVLILGTLSWSQAWIYENQQTLWTYTLEHNPDCWVGYNDLGDIVFQKGDFDQAIVLYEKALAIHPDYAIGQSNLGCALAKKGHDDEARIHYQKALEINPDNPVIQMNIGDALIRTGHVDEAMAYYQKSEKLNPASPEVHNCVGVALTQKGRLTEAVAEFQEALRLQPGLKSASDNLAIVQPMLNPKPPVK